MKRLGGMVVFALFLVFAGVAARAQQYSEFQFFFNGMAYETNASGKMVGTPITDQTLLADRARLGQITDLSTLSIVYHLNGSSMGDTIDIVSNATGQVLTTELGLYFGSDGSLGRTAVISGDQTSQRRMDYIYTDNNSTYTFSNSDSVGESMTAKSVASTNGITNAIVSGTMSWGVAPRGTNGPILCIGKFSTGQLIY